MRLLPSFSAGISGSNSGAGFSLPTEFRSGLRLALTSLPLVVAGLFIFLHPLNAELVRATPGLLAAQLMIVAGGFLVLRSSSWRAITAGTLLLSGAAWIAPLLAWPAFLIPLCRRDLGWKRLLLGMPVLLVASAVALLLSNLGPGLAELVRDPIGKGLEVTGLLNAALTSAIAPFATPHLGTTRLAFPIVGTVLIVLSAVFLLRRVIFGVSRRVHTVGVLLSVGVLLPIGPTLLGMPRLSTSALLVWMVTIVGCQAVSWLAMRVQRSRTQAFLAVGVVLVAAISLILTERRASAAFDAWSNEGSAWSTLLAEDPCSPYRWEYSEWLRGQGDVDGAKREAIVYFDRNGASPSRRLEFALAIVRDGDETAAFRLLKRLDGAALPSSEADCRAVMALYEKQNAWALYFTLAESALDEFPDLRLDAAKVARRLERMDLFRKNLDALIAAERPSTAALELKYRDLTKQQDIVALAALGDRTIGLHPDSFVGYAARGKAAKIVRDDDEMIRFHEEALRRDPNQPDLHWDLGLVYHGRIECTKLAIEHYRTLLDLVPAHPRRLTIETWIESLLYPTIPANAEPMAPRPADAERFAVRTNAIVEQAAGRTSYEQATHDPTYPTTGQVRIDKPDISVPSVGFPFAFWRCYRAGVSYEGPLGQGWDFNFNMRMELDGNEITSWDGSNRVDVYGVDGAVWTPPKGRFDKITYDGGENLYTRTEPNGFKYIYDPQTPSGGTTKMRIKKWIDLNDNELTFTYASSGANADLTGVTDTNGRSYTLAYDHGRLTTLTDSTSRVMKYEYSGSNLTKVTELYGGDTLARFTTYGYDSGHRVTTITDPKQNAGGAVPFCRNYYESGSPYRLIAQDYGPDAGSTPESGNAFTLAYSTGYTTSTDRCGTTIKYSYDSDNLITEKQWQSGSTPTVSFEYDTQCHVTKTTKPDGSITRSVYDSSGNLVTTKSTDSGGGNILQTTFEYQVAYNRLTRTTDPSGVVTQFTYDGRGNLASAVVDSGGGGHLNLTTAYHYDSGDHYLLDYFDDPNGIRTEFDYDGSHQLVGVTRDSGGLNLVTSFVYDSYGNVITTTDARGKLTIFTVNALNQVTQVTNAGGYYTQFMYDKNDNVITTKTENGSGQGSGDFEVVMAYDILDNLTSRTADIDGSSHATTLYLYDLDDKLTKVTDPEGTHTVCAYNDFDVNTSVTLGYGSGDAATYSYLYDTNFRLTEVREPKGSSYKTTYLYDHHDRVTKAANASGNYVKSVFTNQLLTATESYSSGDALLAKTTYAHDSASRLTKTAVMAKDHGGSNLGADGWLTSTLVLDDNGNVITAKDDGNHETHFTYDHADRVSIVEDAAGSKATFIYDGNGNVVTKTLEEKQIGVGGFDTYVCRYGYCGVQRNSFRFGEAKHVRG